MLGERVLTLYLSGAIRDAHPEDIEWREGVIHALRYHPVCILNPLGGKRFDPETQQWTMSGIPAAARAIVPHDFWAVDHADIVVTNFRALSQNYPNIGTLVEFGRATARGCLMYSIIDPDYQGTDSPGMYKLHPFLEQNSAVIFPEVGDCIEFLKQHLMVLSGRRPRFVGPVGQTAGLNPFYPKFEVPAEQTARWGTLQVCGMYNVLRGTLCTLPKEHPGPHAERKD